MALFTKVFKWVPANFLLGVRLRWTSIPPIVHTIQLDLQKYLPTILRTFGELEQATNSKFINLYSWLKANKLSLNIAKTEFIAIYSTRQKFFAENFSEVNIQLDSQPICTVEHAKSLGLIIDDRLSWSYHIEELCRKISSAIGALKRIRSLISRSTAVQIYNALIQPHFDYCAPVWDG